MAIFLHFWSKTMLLMGNENDTKNKLLTQTFQAKKGFFRLWKNLFFPEKVMKQNELTMKKIAFDSNKWETVTFCVKDRIVLQY